MRRKGERASHSEAQFRRGELPAGWDADLPSFPADAKGMASRESSAKGINAIARHYPGLISGSADLSSKTNLTFEAAGSFVSGTYGDRLAAANSRGRPGRAPTSSARR